jgi:hypothetical protein
VRVADYTLLLFDDVLAPRACSDLKRQQSRLPLVNELNPRPEMRWMSARPSPHLLDASALTKGMIERRIERIGDHAQRVEEVALA